MDSAIDRPTIAQHREFVDSRQLPFGLSAERSYNPDRFPGMRIEKQSGD